MSTPKPGPKITLRIDRIVSDQPGFSREALTQALRHEIGTHVARAGVNAFGPGRNTAVRSGRIAPGKAATADRVATAAIKTLRS